MQIMTGGDVGPLGPDAVTQLHKLFDWSESTRRGLLLFIDEADAFLGKRSRSNMSENQVCLLTSFRSESIWIVVLPKTHMLPFAEGSCLDILGRFDLRIPAAISAD